MYATVGDMIARFGEVEMIRLSAPEGQLDGLVDEAAVTLALTDASAVIDSYLRSRHAVPLAAPVPAEIARACRILARYELAQGEQKAPTDQMKTARGEVMTWLRDIADGKVELGVPEAVVDTSGQARATDRDAAFTGGALMG